MLNRSLGSRGGSTSGRRAVTALLVTFGALHSARADVPPDPPVTEASALHAPASNEPSVLASKTDSAAGGANAAAQPGEQPAVLEEQPGVLTDEEAGLADAAATGQLLKFYGFGDMGYRHFFVAQDSPWFLFLNRQPSFFVGNLNLYLDAQLSERWRALAEVRFTYLPNGAPSLSSTSPNIPRQDADLADYTNFSRKTPVGGIVLERATLEYSAFPWLSISGGHWLTPYGIWNVDHGSPVIIGVTAPFIIGAQLIPTSQVGVLGQGTTPLIGNWELGYAFGISNGRAAKVPFEDLDGNKAVTARVAVTYRAFGESTLGGTFYAGRSTQGANELYFVDGRPKSRLNVSEQFDERSYAADFKWVWRSLHLQTEWLLNERRYTDSGRPRRKTGLAPNTHNLGGYALVGYRTPLFGVMPYASFEYSADPLLQALELADSVTIVTCGLNIRPEPRVVFKAEYSHGSFSGGGPQGFAGNSLQGVDMQAAWAF